MEKEMNQMKITMALLLSAALSGAPASAVAQEIARYNEGNYFYTSITIPPGAETMYLSGSGARPLEDGSWGDMKQQTINTFTRFKQTLEEQGWSMSDIVQVRAFAVAGDDGLDFAGFNEGYSEFFGTDENPNKPVRSFVEIKDLVVEGWLVEIEIRAARISD
ncbi:MAG: endonuclease [Gammaproteobacteria bacterium]|nr:endonuclease [Gammaproteobacteria bacterium]HBW84327.1 endonuclease [Gammaproteobacteria bacterium]|tara:strand:+ start:2744 stop:3229 length:486 start_codon:yes stop_codon:yes gene_type:complete